MTGGSGQDEQVPDEMAVPHTFDGINRRPQGVRQPTCQKPEKTGRLHVASSGLIAMTISQPMATYIRVESSLNRIPATAFRTIPATATPQTRPNRVQPQPPNRTPRVNGV